MKHSIKIFILMLLANTAILQAQEGYTPRHYSPLDPQPFVMPSPEETPEGYRHIKPMILGLISIADTANPTSTFVLYPNPAKDYVELHWDWFAEGLQDAIVVRVYNNTGTLIQSHTIQDYMKNVWMLRTEDLQSGLFIIEIKDAAGNMISTQKLTVIK